MKAHAFPRALLSLVVAVLLSPFWAAPSPALAAPPVLQIDLKAPSTPISPILHGLMTEEINHSYDGGLYAELIRNRAFLDDPRNQPVHWSVVKQAGADGAIRVVPTHPLTDKLSNSLEVDVKAATPQQRFRVDNDGYWGIPIKPGTTYRASFYEIGRATCRERGEMTG